jgi:nicotinamide-nucleotide amidase
MNPQSCSAEIICVGTELLLGDILNSNAQFLAQELARLGIPHHYQTVVGDNPARIQGVVETACQRYADPNHAYLLIFTGGLGPTPDDLTHTTLADTFGVPMVEHAEILTDMEHKFAERGRVMTANNRKQALLPQGAAILTNASGTAPGVIWQPRPTVTVLSFPGVPTEMRRMWTEVAVPYLQAQGWATRTIYSRTLRFWGVPESALAERVHAFFDLENPTVAPYANKGEVKLRISAQAESAAAAQALIAPVEEKLRAIVGRDCYGADQDSLASVVGDLLRTSGGTLAVAESCTGGGLGQALTTVAGSSSYFWGGVIAYDNAVKEQVLGVSPTDLQRYGAVSAVVAEQMAVGVRDRLGTTWGVSITGIAGPDGGTADKPVGLVYVGVAGPTGVTAQEHRFGGGRGREWVRHLSTCAALDHLRRVL